MQQARYYIIYYVTTYDVFAHLCKLSWKLVKKITKSSEDNIVYTHDLGLLHICHNYGVRITHRFLCVGGSVSSHLHAISPPSFKILDSPSSSLVSQCRPLPKRERVWQHEHTKPSSGAPIGAAVSQANYHSKSYNKNYHNTTNTLNVQLYKLEDEHGGGRFCCSKA